MVRGTITKATIAVVPDAQAQHGTRKRPGEPGRSFWEAQGATPLKGTVMVSNRSLASAGNRSCVPTSNPHTQDRYERRV